LSVIPTEAVRSEAERRDLFISFDEEEVPRLRAFGASLGMTIVLIGRAK
jgi:hypothetical protein